MVDPLISDQLLVTPTQKTNNSSLYEKSAMQLLPVTNIRTVPAEQSYTM